MPASWLQQLKQPPASEAEGTALLQQLDRLIDRADSPLRGVLLSIKGAYLLKFDFTSRSYCIELAIEALIQALEILSPGATPTEWAEAQLNLGIAYSERSFHSRKDNLERAIAHTKLGLKGFRQSNHATGYARALINLGAVYSERVLGEHSANLEIALACYQAAQKTLTRDMHPLEWADAEHNKGNIYRQRIKGRISANLNQAIRAFQAAGEVYEQHGSRIDWARNQVNLGIAYARRTLGFDAEFADWAIRAFRSTLVVYTEPQFSLKRAQVLHNLGNAYCDRLNGRDAWNRDRAIVYFRQSLAIRRNADNPYLLAQTLNSLGTAFFERVRGNRSNNLASARTCLEEALEIRLNMTLPIESTDSAHNLALVLTELAQWEHVVLLARRVFFDNQGLLSAAKTAAEQRRLISDVSRLKDLGVVAKIRLHQWTDAFDVYRAGHARLLQMWQTGTVAPDGLAEIPMPPLPALSDGELVIAFLVPPRIQHCYALTRQGQADGTTEETILALPGCSLVELEPLLYEENDEALGWFKGYRAGLKPEGRDQFKTTIERMRQDLQRLLAPLGDYLRAQASIRRISIISAHALSLFPLHLILTDLLDGAHPQTTIDYRMSLDGSSGESPHIPTTRRFLGILDPTDDLPHGRQEGETIQQLFDEGETLTGQEASHNKVLARLQDAKAFSHVHFSGHGRFVWGDAEKSGLELARKQRLTLTQIRKQVRFAPGTLVVLSACETAVTSFRQMPSENFGLPLVFLAAGARHVIATLWPVDDRSTRYLMVRFYWELLRIGDPGRALIQAQLWLRDASRRELDAFVERIGTADSDQTIGDSVNVGVRWSDGTGKVALDAGGKPYAHPYYWAGFCCFEAHYASSV